MGFGFFKSFHVRLKSGNSGPASLRPLVSSPCRPAFHFTWSDAAFTCNYYFHRWQRFMESRRFGTEAWSLFRVVFAFNDGYVVHIGI